MILIHSAGNKKIGIGNLSRCRTLASELVKINSEKVVIIYETCEELMNKFSVDKAMNFRAKDRIEAKDIIVKTVGKYEDKINIIITDLLDLNYRDNIYYKNHGFHYLIHLNDWNIEDYKPDIFINGDAFLHKWDIDSRIKVFAGPEYHMVKPEVVKRRPKSPWNEECVDNILVCFGGSDPAYYTEMLVKNIYNNHLYIHKNFNVILGPVFSEKRIKEILKYKADNINFINNPNNIENIILNNDLVITLGGITSYEAMCLGRPVAAFEWKYMKYYIQRLDEAGIIMNLKYGNEGLKNFYDFINEIDKLKLLSKNGWKTIDGKGVERVAKLIYKQLKVN